MTIRNMFGIGSDVPVNPHVFIGGAELEIEAYHGAVVPPGWNITEDGSLRNSGKEFISPPLVREDLLAGFKKIHTTYVRHPDHEKFTERTSIHVHVNCLDLEPSQVRNIVLWYALFEPVFFAMCSPIRANNIHCVPLDQTHLPVKYKKNIEYLHSNWSKYTALNLLPLSKYGTIEFRHMEGHDNIEKFDWWLKTLENLWTFGKDNPLTKDVLASQESILSAFDVIFQDAPIKEVRSSVPGLIADTLIDVKLSF